MNEQKAAPRQLGTITIHASRKIRDSVIVTREPTKKPAPPRRCLCCGGLAHEVAHHA